ncbi:MAG: acetyl-CoA acyltransferase, partial [Actinomycetota bacterium]|nr:acetyl-CoA acyltransferase [Actinomycetota bacterium]
NSSQISDGASALLMTSAEFAEQRGLEPVLTLEASASAGADPVLMLTAVIPATRKLLQKTGLSVDDIAAFEVNEAFASVVLAWQRELGVPDEKVNPLGGAIAYGHPLGATGGRLIGSLAAGLSPGEYGIVTICGGGGVATASLFRRC